MRYADPGGRVTEEGRNRELLGHRGDYEEWGIEGSIRVTPGADGQGEITDKGNSGEESRAIDLQTVGGGASGQGWQSGSTELRL